MSDTENSTDNRPFARPFGGVPVQYDFAITLLFGIGFAVAFGIDIYTICRKKTRTLSKALTANVSFERMFSFTLRMAQALLFDFRESHGINEYLQASFSVGFITLMQEQLYLILCAATSASRDGLSYQEWQRAVEKNPGIKDARKDEREKIRNSSRLLDLCIVVIQGLQVTISVLAVITKSNRGATWMLYFRFFSNLMALLIASALLSKIHSIRDVEGINKAALKRMKTTIIILLFVPLSRCFLSFETSTTLSASPADAEFGTIMFKVTFYVLQILPELAACLITAVTDYKALCDTGLWGDWPRWRVECGLPTQPRSITILLYLFMPWNWPRLLTAHKEDQKQTTQEKRLHEYGFKCNPLSYDDGEKLLPNTSSVGWQSSINLSDLGRGPHIPTAVPDVEKQSIMTEVSFSSSNKSSSWGSKTSSVDNVGSKSSLVVDVNLWRPRFPAGLSSGTSQNRIVYYFSYRCRSVQLALYVPRAPQSQSYDDIIFNQTRMWID